LAFTRAGELTDNSVSEAYSSSACACKNRNGENLASNGSSGFLSLKNKKVFLCKIEEGFYIAASSNQEDMGDQATEEFAHGRNFRHHV